MNNNDIDLKKGIEEFDLCFLDLETTGLDVITGDTICEIGIIKVRGRNIVDKFESLVNPKQSIPSAAYLVHKISDADLKNAPYFENIADSLLTFINNSVVCAYNVEFDMGFTNFELKKMGREQLTIPAIDILAMARKTVKLSRYNLGTIATFFNVDGAQNLHRAVADAYVAYQVFFKLLDILKAKKLEMLEDYISLFGLKNEIFRSKYTPRAIMTEQAIAKQQTLRIKYLSQENNIEEEHIKPLTLSQENNNVFLIYEDKKCQNLRINFKHILEVSIV